jgi:predicted metal-dependent phosphoesterase TrpH
MIKADLHMHSTVSDGSFTIPELIEFAKKKGLDAIAVTDHDTVSHFQQIPQIEHRVKVIPGIEISAYDYENNFKVHMLGYGIRYPEIVEKVVQPTLLARHENSLKQIRILNKNGYDINTEELRVADGKYIYKQHIMEYLLRRGKVSEMFGDFYYSVFKNNGICDFDIQYISPIEALNTIKEAGGLAVLAHSGQQQNFCLIPELSKNGLDGLEVNHHSNSESDKIIIRRYAEKYGLFLTGGSDFHGEFENVNVEIGDFLSELSGVEAVLKMEEE